MRRNQLKDFEYCKHIPSLNDERGTVPRYEKSIKDKAIIWTVSQQIKSENFGLMIVEDTQMHYYGKIDINLNDMIIYNNNKYRVVSKIPYNKFTHFKMSPIYVNA